MRSALCDKPGIEFPLFAFNHCREVAVEVSNAGGMGTLGAWGLTPEALGMPPPYCAGIDMLELGKASNVAVAALISSRPQKT